jgi:galactose-1-phosphate uridylyltransferase
MSELRKDPVTGRWVIISTERRKRPTDFRPESVHIAPDPCCPFCEGHEEMTPPELLAVRHNDSRPNMPGWNLRVVPNQFPVLRVEGTLDRQGEGIFDKMNGVGAHEVIIESPRHLDMLADMNDEAIEQVLWAARERIQETRDLHRLIAENADMVAVAPYAPRFPFETWVLPRRHEAHFDSSPRHEYASLARLLGDILRRINRALGSPPYNLLIHTAPIGEFATDFYHWHVEIIPKLTKVAGFEWATGFYLNPTSPEEAAQVLRDVRT